MSSSRLGSSHETTGMALTVRRRKVRSGSGESRRRMSHRSNKTQKRRGVPKSMRRMWRSWRTSRSPMMRGRNGQNVARRRIFDVSKRSVRNAWPRRRSSRRGTTTMASRRISRWFPMRNYLERRKQSGGNSSEVRHGRFLKCEKTPLLSTSVRLADNVSTMSRQSRRPLSPGTGRRNRQTPGLLCRWQPI